jgi:hypothetical protein
MPVRFRKSFKVFPGVKVNMSKGGVSFTVGAKGYHLNFSKRGVRQTVGLPGSGISQTSYLVKNESEHKTRKTDETEQKTAADVQDAEPEERQQPYRRGSPAWLILISLVVIYIGALVLGLIPSNFLSQVLHTLTDWTKGIGL